MRKRRKPITPFDYARRGEKRMERRKVLAGLGAAFTWPHTARAQLSTKVFKVGFSVTPISEMTATNTTNPVIRAFTQGMRELGWTRPADRTYADVVLMLTPPLRPTTPIRMPWPPMLPMLPMLTPRPAASMLLIGLPTPQADARPGGGSAANATSSSVSSYR